MTFFGIFSVGIGKNFISDSPNKMTGRVFKSYSVISFTQKFLYLFERTLQNVFIDWGCGVGILSCGQITSNEQLDSQSF